MQVIGPDVRLMTNRGCERQAGGGRKRRICGVGWSEHSDQQSQGQKSTHRIYSAPMSGPAVAHINPTTLTQGRPNHDVQTSPPRCLLRRLRCPPHARLRRATTAPTIGAIIPVHWICRADIGMPPQALQFGSPLDTAVIIRAGWTIPTSTEAPPIEPDDSDGCCRSVALSARNRGPAPAAKPFYGTTQSS
jgi:hypothetical protein